jgi:small-conductance mechanosensitive channel
MFTLESVLLQKLGLIIAIVVVTIIAAWLMSHFLGTLIKRLTHHSRTGLDDILLKTLKRPVVYFIMFAGLWFALQQLGFIVKLDDKIVTAVFFILYLILGYFTVYRLILGLLDWYEAEIAHHTETTLDDQILPFFRRLLLVVLSIIALVILLAHFNVDVSALVATLGVGSLAIALAAKEVLADMISGFIIVIDRPFAIGDRIELEDLNTWGDVQDISLRSTRVLTRDNRLVAIPNSLIGKNPVVNHSIPNTQYRVETHVSVAYDTDIDHARQVMIEAVAAQAWVMKDKKVEALFLEFQDSGLLFRVRCWIEHYVETRRVIDKLNTTIFKALEEAGIKMPFPQRVVHIQNGRSMKQEFIVSSQ